MTENRLKLHDVTSGYGGDPIIAGLDLEVPARAVTTLIGPNGCGKSTLLKTMSALLDYRGQIELAGRDLLDYGRKERARELTMLAQSPIAPDGLSVGQLISRGRHPYQSWLQQWSAADGEFLARAVETTGLGDLVDRPLGALSGGQRQRVWIAMAIAQDADTMLLDEPTTYLDLAHSIDVLRLVTRLRDEQGKTVVMVLHDLNLAARFSDRLVAMRKGGQIAAVGTPAEVLTEELLADVFGLDALVVEDPVTGGPHVIPK